MKFDRAYYSAVAVACVAIMAAGFWPYYTAGRGEGGRVIDPRLALTVMVHGLSITAWYLLSVGQSLLIAVKKPRLHMTLGWSTLGLAPVIAVSGALVAVGSARISGDGLFFGMQYRGGFVLVMLTEVTVFAALVAAGLLTRKRPEIHRALMVAASLSLLIGATTRIAPVVKLFGGYDTPVAFFGPVFVFGLVLLAVNSLRRGKFDRWFAIGFGSTFALFLLAMELGKTTWWLRLAAGLMHTH